MNCVGIPEPWTFLFFMGTSSSLSTDWRSQAVGKKKHWLILSLCLWPWECGNVCYLWSLIRTQSELWNTTFKMRMAGSVYLFVYCYITLFFSNISESFLVPVTNFFYSTGRICSLCPCLIFFFFFFHFPCSFLILLLHLRFPLTKRVQTSKMKWSGIRKCMLHYLQYKRRLVLLKKDIPLKLTTGGMNWSWHKESDKLTN